MKAKLIALMIALMLSGCGALAESIEPAAGLSDLTALKRYASWTDSGGEWSVCSNESAAALSLMSTQTGVETGYFCLALTGDESAGLIQPVLVFYHTGAKALNTRCVSLAADGTRYDLAVSCETEPFGRATAEVMRAPLDERGLAMVRSLADAQSVVVRFTGDSSYVFEPTRRTNNPTVRQQIEAASLNGLSDMLDELDALTVQDYGLWDLNAARWESQYGFAPRISECAPGDQSGPIAFDGELGLFGRGDSGESVRSLQWLLVDSGFMMGRPDGSYGEETERAVRAAQRYYGLMETGCADSALASALTGAAPAVPAEEEADTAAGQALGDLCEVSLSRYWFADSVFCARGASLSASNADNTLLIAEGRLLNTSAGELALYFQVSGTLRRENAAYPCVLVCEADGGSRFDTSLIPQAESRLIVYAEIPRRIAESGGWTLELSAGDSLITYSLVGRN